MLWTRIWFKEYVEFNIRSSVGSGEWEICIVTRFYIPNNRSIDYNFEKNLKLNEIGEMIVKIFYQRLHEVLFRTYKKEAWTDDKHRENLVKTLGSLFDM